MQDPDQLSNMDTEPANETNGINTTNDGAAENKELGARPKEAENEELGARPKEAENEELGARPKEAPAIEYQIKVFEDIKLSKSRYIVLKVFESGITFVKDILASVSLENIRYVSKDKQKEKEFILLSLKNITDDCITNIFFETEDLEECYTKLNELIKTKLEIQCETKELVEKAFELVNNQPVYTGLLLTHVQEKKTEKDDQLQLSVEAPSQDSPELLVVIDEECISWYDQFTPKPIYQLMFWSAESPVSIESVRLHHGQNYIMFESKTHAITTVRDYNIVDNMKLLRPKRMNYLSDFHQFKAMASWCARGVVPQTEGWGYEARQHSQGYQVPMQNTQLQDWAVSELKVELDSAKEQFKNMEDIWITNQMKLQELVDSAMVPVTEVSSGGLNSNDQHHFKKAVLDVGDYVKEDNMQTALSRMQALRETFKDSQLPEVQVFLSDLSDLDIIERLFYKSLME